MQWSKRYDAFISYSHKDNDVVRPLVELLSLNEQRVFWDRHLKAGDRWDEVIKSAVKRSSIFVLFWCCDTHESQYVAEEIALALRLRKKIVPVKLCAAVMPLPLNEWQWIDLRQRVQHHCADVDHGLIPFNSLESSVQPQPRSSARKWLVWASCAAGLLLLMFLIAGIMRPYKYKADASLPAPTAQAVETQFFRIPRGAVRTKDGYAVVNSPEYREEIIFPNGQPISIQSGEDGSIILLDKHGDVMVRYAIPWGPPPFAIEFQEAAIPWLYANRAIVFAGTLFATAIALFTLMIVSRRRRAEHTLGIAMDYLRPLHSGNYSLRA